MIPDRWKGMSSAQIEEIKKTQQFQIKEKQVIKCMTYAHILCLHVQEMLSDQQQVEIEWDRRRVAEAKAGLVLENQLNKKKKQEAKELAEQNKLLAAEQKAK